MTTQAGEVIANITISADGYVPGLNQATHLTYRVLAASKGL